MFNQQLKSLSVLLQTLKYLIMIYQQRTNSEGSYWGENLSELFFLAQDETLSIFLFSLEA